MSDSKRAPSATKHKATPSPSSSSSKPDTTASKAKPGPSKPNTKTSSTKQPAAAPYHYDEVKYSEQFDVPEPSVEDVERDIAETLARELSEKDQPSRELTLDLVVSCHLVDDVAIPSGPSADRDMFLQKLRHLRLDRLQLSLTPSFVLVMLPNVTHLYIQHNRLSSLSDLASLPSLKFLAASHNQLQQVEGLSCLTELMFLDISHNQIPRLEASQLPASICFLKVEGNPLATGPEAPRTRTQLLGRLTKLKLLDEPVSLETRNAARRELGLPLLAAEPPPDYMESDSEEEEGEEAEEPSGLSGMMDALDDVERSCLGKSAVNVRSSVHASELSTSSRPSSGKSPAPGSQLPPAGASSPASGSSQLPRPALKPAAASALPLPPTLRSPSPLRAGAKPAAAAAASPPLPRTSSGGGSKMEAPLLSNAFREPGGSGGPKTPGTPPRPSSAGSGSGAAPLGPVSRPGSGRDSRGSAAGAGLTPQGGEAGGGAVERQVEEDMRLLKQRMEGFLRAASASAAAAGRAGSRASRAVAGIGGGGSDPADGGARRTPDLEELLLQRMMGDAAKRVGEQRQQAEAISGSIRALRQSGGALGQLQQRAATSMQGGGGGPRGVEETLHPRPAAEALLRRRGEEGDRWEELKVLTSRVEQLGSNLLSLAEGRPRSSHGRAGGAAAGRAEAGPARTLENVAEEEGGGEAERQGGGRAAGRAAPGPANGVHNGGSLGADDDDEEDDDDDDDDVDIADIPGFQSSLPPKLFS